MNAYIKRDDVVKALIQTKGQDFVASLSAVIDLPVVDLDEKDREIERLKKSKSDLADSYIKHLKQDCRDAAEQALSNYALACIRGSIR